MVFFSKILSVSYITDTVLLERNKNIGRQLTFGKLLKIAEL